MAIAISNLTNYGPGAGGSVTKTATITFDSSYPTGGEAVTAANFGLSRILSLTLAPNIGYVFEYVPSTSKIKAYWVDTTTDGAPLAEVVDTTSMATAAFEAVVVGIP